MCRRRITDEVARSLARWGLSDVSQLSGRLGLRRKSIEDALFQLRRRGRVGRVDRKPAAWRLIAAS